MGEDNDMTRCIADLLHVFFVGMLKSMAVWILIIISAFSEIIDKSDDTDDLRVLDDRLQSFPKINICLTCIGVSKDWFRLSYM